MAKKRNSPHIFLVGALTTLGTLSSAAAATTYDIYPGQSIQAIIALCVDGDVIRLHPGRYRELIILMGRNITITGTNPNDWDVVAATILDGDGAGPVVACVSGEHSAILRGLTITGGDGSNEPGGVYILDSRLTLDSCWVLDNASEFSAGGVGVYDFRLVGRLGASNCLFSFNENGAVGIGDSIASLDNCTFINNSDETGGAISSVFSALTLTDCTFSGNTADDQGGALWADHGTLTATRCVFHDNHGGSGGGACVRGPATFVDCQFNYNTSATLGGGLSASNPLVLTNSSFAGNSAVSGGGLYLRDGDTNWSTQATVSGCDFTTNTANAGGGLYLHWVHPHAPFKPTVIDCRFTGNAAAMHHGGGIANHDGSPRIIDCAFMGNTAVQGGGAICSTNELHDVYCTLIGCDFRANVGEYGGGVYNYSTLPSSLIAHASLTNCSFIHNWGLFTAGGLFNFGVASATVTNCTFTANVGYNDGYYNGGGGIVNTNSVATVNNCILWGNLGGEIWNLEYGSCAATYSDVQGGYAGTGNINADPLFTNAIGPDGVWGTLDDDVRLATGSPCIDAADCTALPADAYDLDGDGDTAEPIPIDIAGLPRLLDDPNTTDTGVGFPCVDMGAHELLIPCAGDLDGDGDTDQADLGVLLASYNTDAGGDLDGDGDTDQADLGTLLADYGCTP
jgi:predicted outer membrane repeat protein